MARHTDSTFYVTGGTLRQDAACYVERRADRELLNGLLQGEFCYVLTSRQMGKSSLMVRTAGKLREQGVKVAVLDLTAIGQNLTPEQWYDGLLVRMGRQLDLEDELEEFWTAHPQLGPCQRFFTALREVVLGSAPVSGAGVGVPPNTSGAGTSATTDPPREPRIPPGETPGSATGTVALPKRVVLFVDELDVVRSLPFSTDEFFAAIRECYTRRAEDPEFQRLTFCLLGVATPSDLIRDTRLTPFNIGRRIELNDFTTEEARPLAAGLDSRPSTLDRILHWTNGHPYLTQRLCREIAQFPEAHSSRGDEAHSSAAGDQSLLTSAATTSEDTETRTPEVLVDSLCETLFFTARAREQDDNLLFVRERMLRADVDRASLLHLYEHVVTRKRVRDDETNPLVTVLRLSGVVRTEAGWLEERNRIYERVFNREWIRASMPDAEVRRQREAYWRGVVRATALAGAIVVVIGLLALSLWRSGKEQTRLRELADANLYVADMHQVAQAIEMTNLEQARELLQAHRHQTNLLGFEWRYLWQQSRSQELWQLRGHSSRVRTVIFSRDGRSLASRSLDGVLKVWDTRTRTERFTITNVPALGGFAPDGNLTLAKQDGSIGFISAASGHDIRSVKLPEPARLLLAEGRLALTRLTDGDAAVRDVQTGREILRLALPPDFWGQQGNRTWIAASPDGRKLGVQHRSRRQEAAGASGGLSIDVWDLIRSQLITNLTYDEMVIGALEISPDGTMLVAGGPDGTLTFWDLTTFRQTERVALHEATVQQLAFSPDGTLLASGSADQTIVLWNLSARQAVAHFGGHGGIVADVAFSPDGSLLASGHRDGSVRLWHTQFLRPPDTETAGIYAPTRLVFSADGKRLIAGCSDSTCKVFDVQTLKPTQVVTGVNLAIGLAANGRAILRGVQRVVLFDFQNGESTEMPIHGAVSNLYAVAVSSNGRISAWASALGVVQVWDNSEWRELARFNQSVSYGDLCFSPDGSTLLSSAQSGRILLWNSLRGSLTSFKSGLDSPYALAISPDGRMAACEEAESLIRVWKLPDGEEVAVLKGHRQHIHTLVFSPDGRTLASCSNDGTVRLWNVPLGKETAILRVFPAGTKGTNIHVWNLAFSPNGNTLAAYAGNGTLKVWRAASWQEIKADEGGQKR